MRMPRRPVELAVVSDVHLGTYGSHAAELHDYLKRIRPRTLVLNGDIIDIWQFSKRYWPNAHTKVLKQVLGLAAKGCTVYYLTGNHDEKLRKLDGLSLGDLHIRNTLSLKLDGRRTWFFHGDVFDAVIRHSKWLARIGAVSYDGLIVLNAGINHVRAACGLGKVSLSKRIKHNVKSAVAFVNRFETAAATLARQKGYDTIVCGHIHQPADHLVEVPGEGPIRYLNSGDWVENLTALEYDGGQWRLYRHGEADDNASDDAAAGGTDPDEAALHLVDLTEEELFANLLAELTTTP